MKLNSTINKINYSFTRTPLTVLVFAITSLSFFSGKVNAQTYNINTYAGGGIGDGYSATSAASKPSGTAIDASGNIYIADGGFNRVRKVTTAGIITTIAGTGIAGFSGDGAAATAAQLNNPMGVAVDASGNIFIADYSNYRIREINTSGIISTVAGTGVLGYTGNNGPATAAELTYPQGIAVSGSNIYISDQNDNVVRIFTVGGNISIYAGNGTATYGGDNGPATGASLNGPVAVATDNFSDVYIADQTNNRIRKVNSGGTITTVVGNGTGSYSGDGGPGGSATIYQPSGVFVDASGNLYIDDEYNQRIRKLGSSGLISTIAGNGTGGYIGDGGAATSAEINYSTGITADGQNNAYIVDNGRIRQINSAGIITTYAGGGAGDGAPASNAYLQTALNSTSSYSVSDVITDGAGDLFIADIGNERIRQVSSSGLISTIAGDGIAGYAGNAGKAANAELYHPTGIAKDAAGNMYIADTKNGYIRMVNTSGVISTIAGNGNVGTTGDGGPATLASFYQPTGVATDGSGNIYVVDHGNNRVRVINSSGTINAFAGNGTAAYAGDGAAATAAELSNPTQVSVDGQGNVFIADALNNRIRKVSTTGMISTIAGNGTAGYKGDGSAATAAELNRPVGVMVNGSTVYISDNLNNCVRRVNSNGIISTIAGNGIAGFSGDGAAATAAQLNAPSGIALDAAGNIYVSDDNNNRVRELTNSCTLKASVTAFTNVLCYGASTGSATVSPTNGTGPYSYSWSPSGGTNATANNLSAGNYSVMVTDANGCTASTSTTLTQSPAITGTFKVTNATCGTNNGEAIVTAAGGTPPYIYAWNSGSISDTASKLPAGLYQATIVDSYHCSVQLPVTVTSSNGPTVTPTVTNVTCNGMANGSITLAVSGTGPFTYNWSKGKAQSCSAVSQNTTQNLTNLAAGTYQVTVTDGTGCNVILSITVTQPSALSMNTTITNAGCTLTNGSATANVSGGTSPYTYSWNNAATTTSASISSVGAGTYPVVVTDKAGCKDSITAVVNNTNGPVVTVTSITNTDCGNSTNGAITVSDSGGAAPFTYLWSDGKTTSNIGGLTTGVYNLTITDNNNCKGSASAIVDNNTPIGVPICMVTVDTNQKNLVIWNRTGEKKIQSYNVYREASADTTYNLIGNVCATSITEFFDSVANSQLLSYTYKLSEIDSCGKESPLSPSLNSIHLSVYPNTNGTSIKLVWDLYIGSFGSYYYIYRDTIRGKYTLYDSVPNTSVIWNDKNPLITKDTVLYCVGIQGPDVCNPTARTLAINYNAGKSNTGSVILGPLGIQNIEAESNSLEVYPNPTNGVTDLRLTLTAGKQNVGVKVFNAIGEVIWTDNYITTSGHLKTQLDLSQYSKGIYFVQVTTAEGVMYRKIVLQ